MAILIANIGTSDLAIKINNYYIPVGFDRSEPNLDKSGLTPEENQTWRDKDKLVAETLKEEIGLEYKVEENRNKIQYKYSFRELTEKLWQVYQDQPSLWEPRIRPGRIWGVIQTAQLQFSVEEVYLFVTNQVTDKNTQGHFADSYYLFRILQLWFKKQLPKLTLKAITLPAEVPANNQDALLDYYHQFFNQNITSSDTLLLSTKGGTPQMQTALQIQSLSSTAEKQLFLSPQLAIKRILAGEYSQCYFTSYWRYLRRQKYQTVNQILQRWDFEGSREVLLDWQNTLDFLSDNITDDSTLPKNSRLIASVNQSLEFALRYFNLDIKGVENLPLTEELKWIKDIKNNYDPLLNLYTQCCIFWNLNQMANFLSRLGSFCEEILHELIRQLGAEKYFDKQSAPHDWHLCKQRVEEKLWQEFALLERSTNYSFARWDFQKKPRYRLPGRFSKRNFVEALVKYQGRDNAAWQDIIKYLTQLDYWLEKRNQLIHSAEGISKERMKKILAEDRTNNNKKPDKFSPNPHQACGRDEILTVMTILLQTTYKLLSQPSPNHLNPDAPYYIYSQIANWIQQKLKPEKLA
ncbi:MAG: hypothetical protein WBG70_01605 [Spirulinaceae cyanobacterium]